MGVETGDERRGQHGELGRLLDRNAALRDVFAEDPTARQRLAELQRWQSDEAAVRRGEDCLKWK